MAKLRRGRPKRLVLDVGASSIRLCELVQTKTGLTLSKYFHREILNDPSLDEETKKKQRRESIKALLKEAKVRNRKTLLCVPGRSVFTRTRTLPPVPQYKVAQIVRYEIQQQIPFGLDQIALDYQILNRTEAGSYDVMMVAIKVDVVDKHLEVLKETKCRVDSVDVSPIAAYNWFKHTGEFGTEGECVALLDIGASTTDIVIERGNQFRFTRPLNIGGDDITRAISTTFNVPFSEAEKLKRQRGFAPTGDPKVDGRAGECIGQVLSRMVNEISRSFGYFRSLPGGGTVDRVIVTGGCAKLRNLIPYLQRHLGLEVRITRPLAGLTVGPNAQAANEHADQAAVALGMALRNCEPVTIEVNLIPPQVIEAARRKEQALFWVLSLITLGFIAASVIPARANQDRLVREEIKRLEAYLEKYDPELAKNPKLPMSVYETELQEARAQIDLLNKHLGALKKAYEAAPEWLEYLKLLNELRPEGSKVWFSSVETSIVSPVVPGQQAGPGVSRPRGPSSSRDDREAREERQIGFQRGGSSPAALGYSSTGFGSLAPQRMSESQMGGRRAIPGSGRGALGGAAVPDPTTVPPPPSPNGFRVLGYARDADSLMLFISRLRESPQFKPPTGNVYFNEATVEEVHITQLDDARTVQAPTAAMPMGGGGGVSRDRDRDRDRRGVGGLIGGGAMPYSSGTRAGSVPVGGFLPGESVFFFSVDLMFAPPPAPPQPVSAARLAAGDSGAEPPTRPAGAPADKGGLFSKSRAGLNEAD